MSDSPTVQLPAAHQGCPITWGRWNTPGVASCGRPVDPQPCALCGHVGLRFRQGVAKGEQRVSARHCPGCGATEAFWRTDPDGPGHRVRLERIAMPGEAA
jgi:hypothetical protein